MRQKTVSLVRANFNASSAAPTPQISVFMALEAPRTATGETEARIRQLAGVKRAVLVPRATRWPQASEEAAPDQPPESAEPPPDAPEAEDPGEGQGEPLPPPEMLLAASLAPMNSARASVDESLNVVGDLAIVRHDPSAAFTPPFVPMIKSSSVTKTSDHTTRCASTSIAWLCGPMAAFTT